MRLRVRVLRLCHRVAGLVRAVLTDRGPGEDAGVCCVVSASLEGGFDWGEARAAAKCGADVETGVDGGGIRGCRERQCRGHRGPGRKYRPTGDAVSVGSGLPHVSLADLEVTV